MKRLKISIKIIASKKLQKFLFFPELRASLALSLLFFYFSKMTRISFLAYTTIHFNTNKKFHEHIKRYLMLFNFDFQAICSF